ncbi:TPA: hypothetical protein JBJ82_05260 [Legionella pneumophila]|nr:hypothetical protein [Legionella pneumophila]HAT8920543.1 hypothetical protein [Legionella pneumophila subsp. pneumophila]HAT8735237.1 hypothetical protein [Legionella pneumophila]HAT8981977.1 hypothetical protein [Legionella pneumophila subsp. pneumophila]HAT9038913.1 hypothetical protein [Legionella pneumophila subsp. pneumophila]
MINPILTCINIFKVEEVLGNENLTSEEALEQFTWLSKKMLNPDLKIYARLFAHEFEERVNA